MGADANSVSNAGNNALSFLSEPLFQLLLAIAAMVPVAQIVYVVFFKARPEANKNPKEIYIDDEKRKVVEIFDLELKYACNFFRRKFKLFRYKGEANYDIWGGSNIPKDDCEEKFEKNHWWVFIKEKRLIEYGRISKLSVYLESEAGDYRDRVDVKISGSRAVIINKNDKRLKFYSFPLEGVSLTPELEKELRKDPKVHDVYLTEGEWIVSVKELPATMFGNPGREVLKLDFLSKH